MSRIFIHPGTGDACITRKRGPAYVIRCQSVDGFAVRTPSRCIWENVCDEADTQAGIQTCIRRLRKERRKRGHMVRQMDG